MLFSQSLSKTKMSAFKKKEMEIVKLLKYDEEFDEMFSKRKEAREKLISFCQMDSSYFYPFDSLKNYSNFKISADQKVRIISWDLVTGGTWHDYASIAHYDSLGVGRSLNLHEKNCYMTDCEYEDVSVYDLFDIEQNGKTYYLTFGYGTHGSGHHHRTARIFFFDSGQFKQHKTFLNGKTALNIVSARRDNPDLYYDEVSKSIRHKEFDFDNDIGFAKATGKILFFKLTSKGFQKQ